jgi:hypothetical protein
LGQRRTGIFLRKGLDTEIAEQPVGQIRGWATCGHSPNNHTGRPSTMLSHESQRLYSRAQRENILGRPSRTNNRTSPDRESKIAWVTLCVCAACANLLPALGRELDRDVRRGADDPWASVRVGLALGPDQRFQDQDELFGEHGGIPFIGDPITRCCRAKISSRLRGFDKMVSSIGGNVSSRPSPRNQITRSL